MKTKATPISHPTDIHLKQLLNDATNRFSMINRMISLMESPKFHFFDSDLVWDVSIPTQDKKKKWLAISDIYGKN